MYADIPLSLRGSQTADPFLMSRSQHHCRLVEYSSNSHVAVVKALSCFMQLGNALRKQSSDVFERKNRSREQRLFEQVLKYCKSVISKVTLSSAVGIVCLNFIFCYFFVYELICD